MYKDGVTVLIHTLNNGDDIEECLTSILRSKPDQLIVADGSSSDDTAKTALSLGAEVYITEPGFHIQQAEAFKHVEYKYLLIIEADQRFPEGFILDLLDEFKHSSFDGLQATLECVERNNFWERGIAVFYDIHNQEKGQRDIIGGPAIYLSDVHIKNLKHENVGFAGDTIKAEQAKKLKLTFGLGSTVAQQKQTLTFTQFKRKYIGYGRGDFYFYESQKHEWGLRRKLRSVTHVARRYFLSYPIKAVLKGDLGGAAYLVFSGIVRYYGWFSERFYKKAN